MIIQIFSSHHLSASEMVDMADQVEKVGDCATLKKEHLRRYVMNIEYYLCSSFSHNSMCRGGFLKNVVHVFTPCLSKNYEVR